LGNLLNDALKSHPDLIYFAGFVSDVTTLLANLPTGDLPVLGGDALYSLLGYTGSSLAGFTHLRFTAFAYPDEWDILGYSDRKPAFFTDYPAIFDPKGSHQSGTYGFVREDNDVIMSFDAMLVLLNGCSRALTPGVTTLTSQDLLRGLRSITGTDGIQGVSGQIAFDRQGNVVNKAIVILFVDSSGYIHMERGLGQFLKS
jgi:eukaryotic-like serine/threonine-protein kinase